MIVPDHVEWSIHGVEGVSVKKVEKSTGEVTVPAGIEVATATLTATCGDASEMLEIRIIDKPDARVIITGVPEEIVTSSDNFMLNAQVQGNLPPDYHQLLWSSDESVLYILNSGTEVGPDGSVQAVTWLKAAVPGTVTITDL